MSIPRVGRFWRWLAVLLWMGLIFFISAQADLPHHPQATWDLILKKMGHFCEYGILAALAFWALEQDGRFIRAREILAVFAFAALYALSDEIHQRFVPGRDPRLLDVAVDVAGAAAALLAMSAVSLSRGSRAGR